MRGVTGVSEHLYSLLKGGVRLGVLVLRCHAYKNLCHDRRNSSLLPLAMLPRQENSTLSPKMIFPLRGDLTVKIFPNKGN